MFSCEYSKSFGNNFFYRTTTVSAFELFYYQKEFVKKKVSGEIAFDVIILFHVQIQEPKLTWIWLYNKIKIWNKKFETRSPWRPKRLRGWTYPLWPLYNHRYKDLSMSRDQKVMTLIPPKEKCPVVLYLRAAFTA